MQQLAAFSLFILVFISGFSRDTFSNLSEIQVKSMVCHKWKLTYLEYKGIKKEIPSKVPTSILIFLQDGSMQEFSGEKKYDGKWTYKHDTKTLTTVDKDGTELHKIVHISNNEFIMNGKYQGFTFNMGFSRLD